jgi:hypothetical protein
VPLRREVRVASFVVCGISQSICFAIRCTARIGREYRSLCAPFHNRFDSLIAPITQVNAIPRAFLASQLFDHG